MIDCLIVENCSTLRSSSFSALDSFLWTGYWSPISSTASSSPFFPSLRVVSIHKWSNHLFHQTLNELQTTTLSRMSSFFMVESERTPVFWFVAWNTITAGNFLPSSRMIRDTGNVVFFREAEWSRSVEKLSIDWLISTVCLINSAVCLKSAIFSRAAISSAISLSSLFVTTKPFERSFKTQTSTSFLIWSNMGKHNFLGRVLEPYPWRKIRGLGEKRWPDIKSSN